MQNLYKNDYFYLQFEQTKVFIEVFKLGFQLKDFDQVLREVPQVALTQFANLRKAILLIHNEAIEIGMIKPLVELVISKDSLDIRARLNVSKEELEANLVEITNDIMVFIQNSNITEGILHEVIHGGLVVGQEVIVAQGIPPIHGEDAQVTYYTLSERKPVIKQDGSADYYEMNFMDEVKKDEWLGEKTLPSVGIPGRNLLGEELPATSGKDKPLYYDRDTVAAFEEGDKIVLRARINGAFANMNGNIMVQEVMIIEGDVGSKTGNIDYDGSVMIKGTINDGFSVQATKDISVLGSMGLGSIDKIISRTGDIYIKGGIFGKDRSVIQAANNIYMKHANECTIEAGGDIHIGLYAIGCKLTADNIFLDVHRGRIIGGKIKAKAQVVTAFIGNEAERSTSINIEGFDRAILKRELDELDDKHQKLTLILNKLKRDVDLFEETFEKIVEERTAADYAESEAIRSKYEQVRRVIFTMDERRNQLMTFLKTKGEGEVTIMRKAFPKTSLSIKDFQKEIEKSTTGVFFVKDKNLFFE